MWMVNATRRPPYPLESVPHSYKKLGWPQDGCGKSRLPPGFDPWTFPLATFRYPDFTSDTPLWNYHCPFKTHFARKIGHCNFTELGEWWRLNMSVLWKRVGLVRAGVGGVVFVTFLKNHDLQTKRILRDSSALFVIPGFRRCFSNDGFLFRGLYRLW